MVKDALSNARVRDVHHFATELDLLENPLEFLDEDHLRTRTVCATLDRIAYCDVPEREDVFECITYVENELPLFIVDEDADLDRLLRARADDKPGLIAVLDRVADLHREIAFRSRPALDLLRLLQTRLQPLSYSQQDCLRSLSNILRNDMAVENAKLLPIARRLLSPEDLADLRSAMFQRRLKVFRDHRAPHG